MNAFAELVEHQAAARSDERSFLFLDARGREISDLSWNDFATRTRAVAASLIERGLAGKRVCLLCPWGEPFVISLWACLYAGVVPVPAPLDTFERSAGRARAIVDAARPAAAIVAAETVSFAGRVAPGLSLLDYNDLQRGAAARPHTSADPDRLALLQFTSGSTSQPRGVALSSGNVLANCRAIVSAFGLAQADIGVSWLPLHHDMGLIGHALVPVLLGSRSVLLPSLGFLQRPERWLQAIDRYRATTSSAPNFGYEYCVRRAREDALAGLDLSSWRVAICGAEPVDPATLQSFTNRFGAIGFASRAFRPAYGLAETTLLASAGGGESGPHLTEVDGRALGSGLVTKPAAAEAGRRLVACGSAAAGLEIAIVDAASGEKVSADRTGEIVIRGSSVAMGYFHPIGERISALSDGGDGWFHTGDIGFWRDGQLHVIGRSDDTVQVRGRNVHASEVEAVAGRAHPALTPGACAAFGVGNEGTCGIVLLAEVPRVGAPAEAVLMAVREALSRNLDLVPEDVVLVPTGTLPRTTSGKVRRSACQEQYGAGFWSASANPAPAESVAVAGGRTA